MYVFLSFSLSLQGQSKLCNVLFARELHKRLTAERAPVTAVVCHPGGPDNDEALGS